MNVEKKSQLVWDARIVRTLLKKNPKNEAKYCRYCGKLLVDGCDCQQPFEIIDIKKARNTVDGTIAIFANTPWFKKALEEVTEEFKAKDLLKKQENN